MELPESAGDHHLAIFIVSLTFAFILVSTAPPQLRQKENKNKKRNMMKFKRQNREKEKNNVKNGKNITEDNLNNNLTYKSPVSDINPFHMELRSSSYIFLHYYLFSYRKFLSVLQSLNPRHKRQK